MSGENPVKTILVLSANPKGTRTLRLDEEIREIEQGLQRAKQRDNFAFKSGQAIRDFDIHRSILDYEPQIIHFSGHGTGEAGLIFEDEIGQQKLVDAEALAGLFELFVRQSQIECVVLNACYSEFQAKAIAKHIDYVIGMSQEIGDTAAIKFAVGFYDALGAGKDFEFAYELGCRVIRMAGIPENLTPKILRKQDFSGDNIDTTPVTNSSPEDNSRIVVVSPLPTDEEADYKRRKEKETLIQERQQERLESQKKQTELQKQREKEQSPSIIQTQPFEFETATLTVKSSGFLGMGRSDEIDFSRKQAEYFKEDLGNGIFLEMVRIPSGSFLMGSPEGEAGHSNNESPQHTVNIQPFFMGKFPVTQEQYQAIMGTNPSRFKAAKKPVECVTWDNAVEFCGRISNITKKTYRLPSEAEWEYACRAETTTPFYFGETITTDLANYNGNRTYGSSQKGKYREQTTDVGSFPANVFGLYDMHGNVREWCEDNWHDNYQGAPTDGSAWISNGDNRLRLLRGGSWDTYPVYCCSAYRSFHFPGNNFDFSGFRLVCGVASL